MKRLFLYALIMMMAIVSACTRTEQDFWKDTLTKKEQKEVILTATFEGSPETRTVLDNDYTTVLWKPLDEITVFSAGEASKFTSQNTDNAKSVNFKGSISVITGTAEDNGIDTYIYGLYPYRSDATISGGSIRTTLPFEQTGLADSFADDLYISIGRSYTFSMGFWNVCSGYRFKFTGNGCDSVTLTSNDGSPLAGTFVVSFDESGKPIIKSNPTPSSRVTVYAPEGGFVTNTWYYLITLPGTHSRGFTFTVTQGYWAGEYVINDAQVFTRSRFKQIVGLDENLTETTFSLPTPSAVDLGLSVKWASFNLGARSQEEYGDYYAWGETEPRLSVSDYTWENYKWCNGTSHTLTRYNTLSDFGTVDNKTSFKDYYYYDDPARKYLGVKWRTPTKAECEELIENCNITNATINGVSGIKLTSKKSGYTSKWIFFPLGGCKGDGNYVQEGEVGDYWTSSIVEESPMDAHDMHFMPSGPSADVSSSIGMYRYVGELIRPVSPK